MQFSQLDTNINFQTGNYVIEDTGHQLLETALSHTSVAGHGQSLGISCADILLFSQFTKCPFVHG